MAKRAEKSPEMPPSEAESRRPVLGLKSRGGAPRQPGAHGWRGCRRVWGGFVGSPEGICTPGSLINNRRGDSGSAEGGSPRNPRLGREPAKS